MLILLVLAIVALAARAVGLAGVEFFDSWPAATRVGLCAMFLLTASAHFNSMRFDLARMIPAAVPARVGMVYFTGVCEAAGAIGLLVPAVRIYAAIGLIALLVCVLPANIHAAKAGITLRGKPPTQLVARTAMQILLIGLLFWTGILQTA